MLESDASATLAQFSGLITLPTVSSLTPPDTRSVNRFDANTGILLFSEKLFIGAAVKHLLQPDLSFTGVEEDKIPIRLGIHTGAVLYFGQGREKTNYFSPNALFALQGPFKQVNLGMLISVDPVFFGMWYRHTFSNPDALILQVGVSRKLFRLGYSYDLTVSDLNVATTRGTHELALSFNISGKDNSLNPRDRRGIIKCPPFLNF